MSQILMSATMRTLGFVTLVFIWAFLADSFLEREGLDNLFALQLKLNFSRFEFNFTPAASRRTPLQLKSVKPDEGLHLNANFELAKVRRLKEGHNVAFKSRDELGMILEKRGFKVGAELGVRKGIFAETTLKQWRTAQTYLLVDVWGKDLGNVDNRNYIETQRRMAPFSANGVNLPMCRNFTSVCVRLYPDHYFDYIYVDAGHDLKGVYADLVEWWPKLKPGGIFAGRDYVIEGTKNTTGTVVKRFAAEQGTSVSSCQGSWPSWALVKPTLRVTMATFSNRQKTFPVSFQINAAYADHYGYQRFIDNVSSLPGYHLSWEKVAMLNRLLSHNTTDVVLFLDDDAHVNHYWLSADTFLARNPRSDVILGIHTNPLGTEKNVLHWGNWKFMKRHYDVSGRHIINAGVMLVRNTAWSREFFATLLKQPDCDYMQSNCCWEQDCMFKVLRRTNAWGHIGEIPTGTFNCNGHFEMACDPYIWHGMGKQFAVLNQRADDVIKKMSKSRNLTVTVKGSSSAKS